MTIIAACVDPENGGVWIGSDTLTVMGNVQRFGPPKWVTNDMWAVGYVGRSRAMNTAEAVLKTHRGDVDALVYALGDHAREDPWADRSDDTLPNGYLITDGVTLWEVCGGGSITPVPLAALGSGHEFALGAWAALSGEDLPPENLVYRAIHVASLCTNSCGGPPWIKKFTRVLPDHDPIEESHRPRSLRQWLWGRLPALYRLP